jgi:acetyl esterase/lipase
MTEAKSLGNGFRIQILSLLTAGLLPAAAWAAEPKVIPLYPGAAPGSESANYEESLKEVDGPKDGDPRKMHFLYNVTRPSLTVFPADPAKACGTAVIVCPGGGFNFLNFDCEGTEVAHGLNALGVTAFVLKYRLNHTDAEGKAINGSRGDVVSMAQADGLQAMRVLRSRAGEFAIDPNRIGIMGFSAGGWVALAAAKEKNPAVRSNFLISIYAGSASDVEIPKGAGPLFQVVAADDGMSRSSLNLHSAWQKAGLSSELHIYATGGHGFSLIKKHMPVDTYLDRLRDWLDQMGYLKPAK